MGREDKLQEHSTTGPVPALPFSTDDRALTSVYASCFWLKLPKGVGLEMKYSECPALEIWGAAGQSQRTSSSQHTHSDTEQDSVQGLTKHSQVSGSPSGPFPSDCSEIPLTSAFKGGVKQLFSMIQTQSMGGSG